jgi:hypothetical protein
MLIALTMRPSADGLGNPKMRWCRADQTAPKANRQAEMLHPVNH